LSTNSFTTEQLYADGSDDHIEVSINVVIGQCLAGQGYRNKQCQDCLAGFYSNTTSLLPCPRCEPGRANAQQNATVCNQCVPGKYATQEGSLICSECLVGTISGYGYEYCQPCSAGSVANGMVPHHSFSSFDALLLMYNKIANNTECILCGPGTIASAEGLQACQNCDTGRFSSVSGGLSCEECERGKYQPSTGQSACNLCPLGTYQSSNGTASCNQCTAGSVARQMGTVTCSECEVAKYQSDAGQSNCSFCEIGKYMVCDFAFIHDRVAFESQMGIHAL
jgi:hypothetical protein